MVKDRFQSGLAFLSFGVRDRGDLHTADLRTDPVMLCLINGMAFCYDTEVIEVITAKNEEYAFLLTGVFPQPAPGQAILTSEDAMITVTYRSLIKLLFEHQAEPRETPEAKKRVEIIFKLHKIFYQICTMQRLRNVLLSLQLL
ncbi:unnamed protein product [Caenorhabditis auriculariae]|uniref:Uncharacterized protein n=1 Tax=Caenorhabditis auriculariae TaxID=2777116 RepID=A0A8S1HN64_9PELO|nr:unnamed protein product [Caenorhabditis auriculariae]